MLNGTMLSAEIIAIGSELLTPEKTDTNSLWLTGKLNEIGIDVKLKTIVGNDSRRRKTLGRRNYDGRLGADRRRHHAPDFGPCNRAGIGFSRRDRRQFAR